LRAALTGLSSGVEEYVDTRPPAGPPTTARRRNPMEALET
jgi:hypothetical protein